MVHRALESFPGVFGGQSKKVPRKVKKVCLLIGEGSWRICVSEEPLWCVLRNKTTSALVSSWHSGSRLMALSHPFPYPRQGVAQRSLYLLVPGGETGGKVLKAETGHHLGAGSLAQVLSCFGNPKGGDESWG